MSVPAQVTVLERSALVGPNLYAHVPCIKWKIDLGEFEERPSNLIPGFSDALQKLIPSLIEHRCSEGERGGFFFRLESGTWFGHIMEHVALELQNLVGCDVGFGKTRSASEHGVYNVVYECEERETGIRAGEIAMELLHALAARESYPLAAKIEELRETHDRHALGPSTRAIVDAAVRRGIPYMRLDDWNLVQLGYGARAKRIQATIGSTTSQIAVEIAGDKDLTKRMLHFHGVPVPEGRTTYTIEEALAAAEELGWPVVVKPLDASQGRGIVTNIRCEKELRTAYEEALRHRSTVLIERYIPGSDYRLLVVNFKFIAAAMRTPAQVTGDGSHTIRELVEMANADPRRGESHEKVLTKIRLDESTKSLLELRRMTLDTVPDEGEVIPLKTTANLSTGGTAIDVTDHVHPANIELAERIARLVNLDIAGIDIVSPSIEQPLEEAGGAIVEVNAAPGFRMHIAPTEGQSRPVGEAVVDMLFPQGDDARIPIITLTGTNGKTTTARLCAQIARQSGKSVGLTTSDGIYIRSLLVQKGDTTGPQSASVVLQDPTVDFAVLETARGGILRAGVAYDWSNAAVITNIAEDHLGLKDINTLEDLARVKAVTVERVRTDGFAILNAEDDMTPLIRERVDSNLALFSLDPEHPLFRQHVDSGGLGATLEQDWLVLYDKRLRIVLCEAFRVPITFEGRARFNIANALAAVIATYATGIGVTEIVTGLMTFFPSATFTPGRMNFTRVGNFDVVIDYAHNPHGFNSVAEFVRSLKKKRSIAVLGLPGDRRDADIAECARIAAGVFDEIVIREDDDPRDRQRGEVARIIEEAIAAAGHPRHRTRTVLSSREAFIAGMDVAGDGDVVMMFVEDIDEARAVVEEQRQRLQRVRPLALAK